MADPQATRILLAEDDAALAPVVQALLEEAGLEVDAAADGQAALERYEAAATAGSPPDAVLADIAMPRLDGLELLDRLKVLDPEVPVVLMTAYSSVDSAVAALRKGAYDYVTKPFQNARLVHTVQNASRQRRLFAENRTLRRELARTYGVGEVVGRSPGLAETLRIVERAAPTDAAILVRGETGTGKELVARAVHRASPRAERPFVSVSCAALPEALLESELFGHEKGAFTGAVAASRGLFRAAHGGTLFLDEAGEMPPAVQVKLLRALESRAVRPVGSERSVPIDVRLVAATHRDLEALAAEGAFREDLFYRLAVIEVEVPPLRARPEDVPLLARHFLARIAAERGEAERSLAPEALTALQAHPWPGNVRELKNALEHAATLGADVLTPADLPARVRRGAVPGAAEGAAGSDTDDALPTLAELERRHIERALERAAGDRKEASRLLGIDPSTLYRKLKRWEG